MNKGDILAVKYGYMPSERYTKIDNQVSRIKDLSGNAVKLYVFIAGLQNGKTVTDGYLVKALGFSQKSVTKYKNELKTYDLVYTESIHRGLHYMYVGNTIIGASKVKDYIKEDEVDTLTLEMIEDKRRRYEMTEVKI